MSQKIKLLTGMHDILPEEAHSWQNFEGILRDWTAAYAYRQIRTPMLEQTHLFVRSIGEETDVVGKEMYTFDDNGLSVSLRPEGTASCLRSVIEHNYLYNGPQKLWYMGPMFRRERPQKGRYRQFHQLGIEALGYDGPDIDAEIIQMSHDLWSRMGLSHLISLEINTLGNAEERANYRSALVAYLESHMAVLDEDSKRRLYTNPLRVLDTKNPELQEICNLAPKLIAYLGEASLAHYERLKALLDDMGIHYRENPRLVRGLDYYNLTVFEWVTDALGAQGTVCAGGRYNGLIGALGGKDAPAIGFAMGMERLLLLAESVGVLQDVHVPDIYLMFQDKATSSALNCARILRDAGFDVNTHFGGQKIQTQFKKANASGAPFGVLIGEEELATNRVTLKDLRGDRGQVTVQYNELIEQINQWMAK